MITDARYLTACCDGHAGYATGDGARLCRKAYGGCAKPRSVTAGPTLVPHWLKDVSGDDWADEERPSFKLQGERLEVATKQASSQVTLRCRTVLTRTCRHAGLVVAKVAVIFGAKMTGFDGRRQELTASRRPYIVGRKPYVLTDRRLPRRSVPARATRYERSSFLASDVGVRILWYATSRLGVRRSSIARASSCTLLAFFTTHPSFSGLF